ICVIGALAGGLGGSYYLEQIHKQTKGLPHAFETGHLAVFRAIQALARSGHLSSIEDVSDGGLIPTIAECCIKGNVGAELSFPRLAYRLDELLFGEGPARFVVSYSEQHSREVVGHLRSFGVPFTVLGQTGGS